MIDSRTGPYAALILRLSLGAMFLAHCALKVFVFTVPGTVDFFQKVGFPGPLAYVTIAAEFVGGLLLIVGFQTRWVALALLPILLGAASVHWPNGWVFSSPNGGWEFPVFWAVVLVVQALIGDGALAVKRSIGWSGAAA